MQLDVVKEHLREAYDAPVVRKHRTFLIANCVWINDRRRMDRAARLAELWSWLPAFRTVAETQHLPTAAAVLHVSPSALSRSVGLLEAALGQPLFRRVGRRLQLDRAGELLLAATRDAMRRLDDG